MNHTEIVAILEQILTLKEDSDLYQKARQAASRFGPIYGEAVFNHTLAEPLEAALSEQPEFKDGAGFLLHQPNGSASGFYAQQVATALINRTRARRCTAAQAVEWLLKVLGTERASGFSVMTLWGIKVDQKVELVPGLDLLPLDMLPPSSQRDYVLEPNWTPNVGFMPFPSQERPKVALTKRATVEHLLTDASELEPPPLLSPKAASQFRDPLEDSRLALTCIGPSAPLEAASWFQFEDPDIQEAVFFGGISTVQHEIMPSGLRYKETLINSLEAKDIVKRFLGLQGTIHARIRVSLERLNQAMRRRETGDKALELSIALEALLADGQGENTYKIGLRAALMTKSDREERLHNRAIVSAVYALRSAVVHSGTAPNEVRVTGEGKMSSSEVVKQGAAITASVIRRVILEASLPEWSSFELASSE